MYYSLMPMHLIFNIEFCENSIFLILYFNVLMSLLKKGEDIFIKALSYKKKDTELSCERFDHLSL